MARIDVVTNPAAASAPYSVPASTSSVQVCPPNSARVTATFVNDSSATCYLLVSAGAASTTNYSVALAASAYYELPCAYRGAISGVWTAANGAMRVTEF